MSDKKSKAKPAVTESTSDTSSDSTEKKCHCHSRILPAAITFMVTAVLFGGGVYLWHEWETNNFNHQKENPYQAYQKRIDGLEEQLASDKKELSEKTKELDEQKSNEVKLPVVTYEREGLLDTTEKGKLKTKLLDPFLDYYNEEEMTYIAIVILAPENVGEEYSVTAVHKNGGNVGFLFGKRGEDFDFWKPDCMGECEYSDNFKEKYPEIVGE